MPYIPLERFLFRAPLLPWRVAANRNVDLLALPLGEMALALASPDLAAARASARSSGKDATRAALAIDRYRRRAGFRATPHGLWAGVGTGILGPRTIIATGQPDPNFRVAWKRLADLGRALLTDPDVRPHVRLRHAPSVIEGARTVIWLGSGDPESEDGGTVVEKRADRDELLANVLRATATWTPWPQVRTAVAGDDDCPGDGDGHQAADHQQQADDDQTDDLLLTMIDDGLLHMDLVPPLVGPVPGDWMRDRLAAPSEAAAPGADHDRLLGVASVADAAARLNDARLAANAGDLPALTAALTTLPGWTAAGGSGVEATLLFHPPATPTLSRAAVARAAALAPLLFDLQQALAPPAAERVPDAALADALDAATEIFGDGALDLGALTVGDYGVSTIGDAAPGEPAPPAEIGAAPAEGPPRALLTLLVDAIIQATRDRALEARLRSQDIEPLLSPVERPATCELFVAPCRARAGKPPGESWLLGLHAPAGSSWGRFAHAMGEDGAALLEPLRHAEARARPGEQRLDVAFAPRDSLGDICAHPALRAGALALTSWPADDQSALTVADLELCADGAALEPLALRNTRGTPVAPTPLHRVRSTTAPGGIWRLLVGWNLYRQHAPWALVLGPLSDLDWIPRIAIDGFVVAPGSWRLPPSFAARTATARDVTAWRKRLAVPRFVQVGTEDELLPVDLTAPTAVLDLAGQHRVFEIWPPLDDSPDASGRRIEAVIALVDQPDDEDSAYIQAAVSGTATAGAVPAPRRAPGGISASHAWHSFKLLGKADSQDPLLVDVVRVAIRQARVERRIRAWFFLRYVDGPGRRPHLRLRVCASADENQHFARRLEDLLLPARETGDLVAVEQVPYFPEYARFGGPGGLVAAHALFEADSDLACALLALEGGAGTGDGDDGDLTDMADMAGMAGMADIADLRVLCLVATFDTLARGLGLDDLARRDLARRRRDAHASLVDADVERAHGRAFRTAAPHLRDFLGGRPPAGIAAALDDYHRRARKAGQSVGPGIRDRLLAPLLHLSAVRLTGLDRSAESRAYSYWTRTLDSLARHR